VDTPAKWALGLIGGVVVVGGGLYLLTKSAAAASCQPATQFVTGHSYMASGNGPGIGPVPSVSSVQAEFDQALGSGVVQITNVTTANGGATMTVTMIYKGPATIAINQLGMKAGFTVVDCGSAS
jgi:hypothetical protein